MNLYCTLMCNQIRNGSTFTSRILRCPLLFAIKSPTRKTECICDSNVSSRLFSSRLVYPIHIHMQCCAPACCSQEAAACEERMHRTAEVGSLGAGQTESTRAARKRSAAAVRRRTPQSREEARQSPVYSILFDLLVRSEAVTRTRSNHCVEP